MRKLACIVLERLMTVREAIELSEATNPTDYMTSLCRERDVLFDKYADALNIDKLDDELVHLVSVLGGLPSAIALARIRKDSEDVRFLDKLSRSTKSNIAKKSAELDKALTHYKNRYDDIGGGSGGVGLVYHP